jgi:hypothetical protein
MADQLLPAELREFLQKHIDSIAQLEAVLLLRNEPRVVWDAQSVAKRLYVGEGEALGALTHLAAQGLLLHDRGQYKFAPQQQDLQQGTAVLADYYRRHLIPITNLIHAKPRRIQQFADAFKVKKD